MCVRETEVYLFLEFAVASSMIWNNVGLKFAKYSSSIEHGDSDFDGWSFGDWQIFMWGLKR